VHVLMYSHYLVSALGLSTPWKPYLTSMQLMQFMLIAVQSGIGLSRGDSCGAPYFGKVLMVAYMGSMLLLFGNFFFHAYILKKPSTQFGGGVVKKQEPVQVTRSHCGRVTLDESGGALVHLPARFADGELTYQITPIGRPMPNLHVSSESLTETECNFSLSGGIASKSVSYTVTTVLTILGEKPKPAPTCCDRNTEVAQDVDRQRTNTPRGGSGKKLR